MSTPVMSSVVRSILTEDLTLSADEVIRKARLYGVTAPEKSIRTTAHNIKSELKKRAEKVESKSVANPPRKDKAPEPEPTLAAANAADVIATPVLTAAPSPVSDLSAVLANVALVNTVVSGCGGAETARQVAEAVRACGGVESFLMHLNLINQVRGATT